MCVSSFLLPFLILTDLGKLDTLASIGISFYIYFLDVKSETNSDYLSEKIKNLENIQQSEKK